MSNEEACPLSKAIIVEFTQRRVIRVEGSTSDEALTNFKENFSYYSYFLESRANLTLDECKIVGVGDVFGANEYGAFVYTLPKET